MAWAGGPPEPPPGAPPAPRPPPVAVPQAPGVISQPPTRAAERAWLREDGTAILGFGLLRVAPSRPGSPGRLSLRYEEKPGDYAAFDAVQLVVLASDAFGKDGRAFADASVAWSRSKQGTYETSVEVAVPEPRLLLVGYGPFSGPDTGRSLTLERAYTVEVKDLGGTSRVWVDPEAGELTVKGWTSRPEVRRGGPAFDPVTGSNAWFEVRLEVLYDPLRLKVAGDPDTLEAAAKRREASTLRSRADDFEKAGKADAALELRREADDVLAALTASDDRIPVPAPLADRLRRVPFHWKR